MSKKLTLLSVLLISTCAHAQTDTIPSKVLDEVVVTANKMEQKQSTTGKVITVIAKAQIEKSAGKTVAQVLNEQAGITINGALNNLGSVQTVYMRGASAGRTLIMMDGIPLNDPSTITTDFDLNLFSINDVERIEICKGAQSTLYGSDAIAGVINIITLKKDIKKPFNVKATIGIGNLNTTKANVQVFGGKDKLSYMARFAKLNSNGFSAAFDSSGKKNFDNDSYNGTVSNAQLAYRLTSKLTLKSFGMFSKYKSGIDVGVYSDDKDYHITNTSFIGGGGFDYTSTSFNLHGKYQYNELSRNYLNDSLDKTSTIYEDNTYFGKSQFLELYGDVVLGKGFTLLTGIDYRFHSYNQHYFSISAFGPYRSTTNDTSLHQKALYASIIYNSKNKLLNIELGGRYNNHSRYGDNNTFTFNPSYTLNQNFRLFGSISSGFKAPSLYQLSINKNLDAEKSMNYEMGMHFVKNKFNARIVLFNRQINNGIDYNYITFKYFNYVKQTVNGLELETGISPFEKLNISANYTFIQSEEITQNRVTTKDTISYDYLLRRPKHSVNITVGVDLSKNLFVSLTGKYVSKRFDIGGYKKADVSLDSYFIANAYIEYRLPSHFKFYADAQNITNQSFYDVRGFNSIPFLFNAGITFNW